MEPSLFYRSIALCSYVLLHCCVSCKRFQNIFKFQKISIPHLAIFQSMLLHIAHSHASSRLDACTAPSRQSNDARTHRGSYRSLARWLMSLLPAFRTHPHLDPTPTFHCMPHSFPPPVSTECEQRYPTQPVRLQFANLNFCSLSSDDFINSPLITLQTCRHMLANSSLPFHLH